MREEGGRVVGSEVLCEREKKASGGGGEGGREEIHGREKESYVREQDLRELSRAERSRVILHNAG